MPAQPKHIRAFELRLEENWSSEDVVQMLTPDFVATALLPGFPALEPTIKMRALIAFLGVRTEQHMSLRDLPDLLRSADDDKDEWVQVVSGLVRHKLMQHEQDLGTDAALSAAVLRKTVSEVLARANIIMDDRSSRSGEGGTDSCSRGDGRKRQVIGEAPYFGPWEERYVSRKQQPGMEEYQNVHFNARVNTLDEFSEEFASSWHSGNTGSAGASTSPTNAAAAATTAGFRAAPGGLMKPPGSQSQPTMATPNLAQARRVNLTATDPSAGSDGRRRTSKPIALAHARAGLVPSAGGAGHHHHLGARKSGGGGSARSARGNVGGGGGRKMGLMMINVDELQAIEAEKESAREKAKGRPGRKKAKVVGEEEHSSTNTAGSFSGEPGGTGFNADGATPQTCYSNGNTDGRAHEGMHDSMSAYGSDKLKRPATPPDAPSIPGAGEIDAVAAMMGLGVAGTEESNATETSYLPPALTAVLANANSLSPEGMEKLQKYFQKKMPEGSQQERVKYHEEITPGEAGEQMRVTSYIRLDYNTWMWDRVHKKKKVK